MRRRTLLVVLVGAALVGCDSGPRLYAVRGTVTVDGVPLEEGEIIVEPLDASSAPAYSAVTAGEYSLRAAPGSKRVVIRATRPVPGTRGMMGEPLRRNYLPVRYNDASELRLDVAPDDNNRGDFELSTQPAR
jgi:hypothetical protein